MELKCEIRFYKCRKILSNNLKAYRAKYKLSQDALATRAGISLRGYSKVEVMEVDPKLETVESLAIAMRITVSYLLSEEFDIKEV